MNRMFTSLALGIVASVSGCASNPFEHATSSSCAGYYEKGEIETARQVCEKVASGDGYYYLSKIENDQGNELASLLLLSEAGSKYKSEYDKQVDIYLNQARNYKESGDYASAIALYDVLANSGSAVAHRELGDMYAKGVGVERNPVVAFNWYKKGSIEGDSLSAKALIDSLDDVYDEGVKYYSAGKYSDALSSWKMSASYDHIDSMESLGDLYRLGKLGEPDYPEAAKWYRSAADLDRKYSARMLGMMLLSGEYIKKNLSESLKYLNISARKGDVDAYFYLAYAYVERSRTESDLAAARAWYERSIAETGSVSAMNNLGLLYMNGSGGPRDLVKAKELFQHASDEGGKLAKGNLESVEALLKVVNKHPASPDLFGVPLYGATRDMMRSAIKREGARPTREDFSYYADTYNSKDVMPGSSQLAAFYSHGADDVSYGDSGDYLARVVYEFSTINKFYIDEIKELLSDKYGRPDRSYGDINVGEVKYYWYEDGVTINVERAWPSLDVTLSYDVNDFKYKMDDEIADSKKAEALKKYEGSHAAF